MDPQREKAMRSIFIANVSFETTEDQLKAVLCEVGPVVSLKLIQDPVTGKSRGFGFCEYEDTETALSACRNLTGREVNGRPLRIDSAMNAPGESFRSSVVATQGPVEPPLYGAPVPPENAPEAITRAVASLPPEQMYELMKQIKWCIQHNPQEARQLLLNNPQLAYALLQAQVVMRIVDLDTAQSLLHRNPRAPPLQPPPPREDRYGRGHPGGRDWHPPPAPGPPQGGPRHQAPPPRSQFPPRSSSSHDGEQEKAALLMQVLSLTDEQIQLLPPDQRNNILRLKEQLSRGTAN